VAKINPVKVKQDAEKEERAGRVDKAIVLYRQLVDDNPRDWNTIKKIGDLYVRLNKNKEASAEYAKVAEFYSRDGFLLKAIAVWKQINKLDPSILEPYVNLADLYAKQGLMVEAKGQYQIVVDEYIKRGRVREAGDALKKMADIDPSDLKVRSKLADLYTRDGNSQKAVEEHIAIADELHRKGHLAEALQVLEKGLRIDAKSVRLRSELARIHIVQKNFEKAVHYLEDVPQRAPDDGEALIRLGEAYLGAKRTAEAETILRRLLQSEPANQEARTQMARVFLLQGQFDEAYEQLVTVVDRLLERKEGERAAALLQQVVQRNSGHVKSLTKLVEVYRALRKESAVILTYSQLTEAYINQGQMEQAAAVLEILQGLEPQNQQHRSKLEFVRRKPGVAATAAARPAASPAPESFVEEDFELATPEEPGPALSAAVGRPAGRSARPTIELSGPLSNEDREFVDEHLAEGRVFRKYGLVDKAADQFDAVISRFPDNVEARQELRDIFKEKGQVDRAVEQLEALAEIHRLKGNDAGAAQAEAGRRRSRSRTSRPSLSTSPSARSSPRPRPGRRRPAPPPPRGPPSPRRRLRPPGPAASRRGRWRRRPPRLHCAGPRPGPPPPSSRSPRTCRRCWPRPRSSSRWASWTTPRTRSTRSASSTPTTPRSPPSARSSASTWGGPPRRGRRPPPPRRAGWSSSTSPKRRFPWRSPPTSWARCLRGAGRSAVASKTRSPIWGFPSPNPSPPPRSCRARSSRRTWRSRAKRPATSEGASTWVPSSATCSGPSPRWRTSNARRRAPTSGTPASPTSSRSSRRASTSSSARRTTTPATTSASPTRRWG
jgi:tetratricopeptide (TPR) repeat protein